jgi:hypothetical protein
MLRPTTYLLILVQHVTVLIEHGYMLQWKISNSLINYTGQGNNGEQSVSSQDTS